MCAVKLSFSQGAFKAVVKEKMAKDPDLQAARVTQAWLPFGKSRPCFLWLDEASMYWLLITA